MIAHLVTRTSSVSDDVWVVRLDPGRAWALARDGERSGPLGGPSMATALRIRASFGLRLHLVCTLSGLPVAFALAGAKADEREVLLGMLDADPNLVAAYLNQKLMADKNYYGKAFEAVLADADVELLRPARKGEKPRPGHQYFKLFRRVIESINNTLKTQLDLESHGGRTIAGVASRVLQRILALTAAIGTTTNSASPRCDR